jgi:hypothetical protein
MATAVISAMEAPSQARMTRELNPIEVKASASARTAPASPSHAQPVCRPSEASRV